MQDVAEITMRLGAAVLIGGAVGINRDLHKKSAGLRTLALVSLVASAVTLGAIESAGAENATRVIQGLLTGVGFLGAGVIVRGQTGHKVHGLTTAAAIWSVTAIGTLCAMGLWPLTLIAVALVFVVLTLGGRVERWLHGTLAGEPEEKGAMKD